MSKKTDTFDLDFNTDDFDFNDSESGFVGSPEPKGRAPVRKLIGGLRSGIGRQLTDEDEQRKFIKKALPDGYDTTYDAVKTTSKAVAGMYRDATKEFDSVNQAAKDAARKLLPRVKQYLPHKMHAKVAAYAGTGRQHYNRDYDAEELQQSMSDIFGDGDDNSPAGKKAAMTPVKDSKDILNLASSMVNAKQQLEMNQGIRDLVRFAQKRDDYESKVGVKLQRKQIELAYRQLFAQQKMLDTLKQTLQLHQASYKDLIQNTSLPDMLKSHKSEELRAVMKKNFYGKIAAPISNTVSGLAYTVAGKVRDKVKSSFRDVASNIAFGSDMLEMMLEMQALEAELASLNGAPMEPAKTARMQFLEAVLENGGAMVGGHFTKKASVMLATWIKKRFGDNEKVKRMGLVGKNLSNNAPAWFQHFLKNSMHGGGLIAGISNWANLGDLGGGKQSMLLQRSMRDDLTKQAFFTVKTEKTINAIIPGLLAKIHQEIRILRTGDTSHEAISYSFENDKFEEAHVRRKRAYNRLFDSDAIKNTAENADKVLGSIDPQGELSPEAKAQMKKYIHDVAHDDSSMMDLRKLVGYDSPLKGKVKDEVTEFLEKKYGVTDMDTSHGFGSTSKWSSKLNRWTDGPTMNGIRADAKASMAYQQMQDKMTQSMKTMRGGLPQDFRGALDMTKEEDLDILRQLKLVKQGANHGDWEYDRSEMERRLKGGKARTHFGRGGRRGNRGDDTLFGSGNTPNGSGGGGAGGAGSGPTPTNAFKYHYYRPNVNPSQQPTNTDQQKVVDKLDEIKKSIEAKNAASHFAHPSASAPAFEFKDAWEEFKAMQNVRDDTLKANFDRHHETQENMLQMMLTQGAAGGGVDLSALQAAVSGGIIKKNNWIKRRWGNVKTMGGATWNGMSGMLKFGARGMGHLYAAPFKLAGATIGAAGSVLGGAMRMLGGQQHTMKKAGGGGMFQGKLGETAVDLYVKGEDTPRLLASKMQAGDYWEWINGVKINKIRWPADISHGEVRDENDNVILTTADFKKGLYVKDKFSIGGKLVAGGAKLIGKGIGLLSSAVTAPFKAAGIALSAAKWLGSKAIGVMSYMNDIYVIGERSPRLLATLLNNGGYICNGAPVMKLRDIVGEVSTLDGQIVLTHADIQKGLVWKNGKPVVLMRDRIMSLAKKSAMLPFKAAGAALGLGFKLLKLPFKAIGLGFKGLGSVGRGLGKLFPSNWGRMSAGDRKLAAGEMQVQLLEQILNLMHHKFNVQKDYQDDGAGMRSGSAIERWKKAIADRLNGAKPTTTGAPAAVSHKGGMGMMLLSAVTGIVGEVKHLKTEAVMWLKRIALARSLNAAAGGLGGMAGGAVGPAARAGRLGRFGRFASRFGTPGKLLAAGALAYGANRMMSDDDGDSPAVSEDGTPAPKQGMWDKYGKPIAGFAASTAAWHYGMKGAGKLFTGAGRAELAAGARGIGSRLGMVGNTVKALGQRALPALGRLGTQAGARALAMNAGRQALMMGARTVLIDGALALGAVVSAPVLIGVAAVAAVGALAYGIYRWKHRKVDVIQNFRMNQYGYDEGDDNHCTQILTLEKMLMKSVKMNGKTAVLGSGVQVKNMMDIFKVKSGDQPAMLKLTTWFQYRFKPVFLGHVTSYYGMTKSTNIFDADTKLNRDQRKQMLNDVNVSGSGSNSPYSYMNSPFNGEENVKLDYDAISERFAKYIGLIDKLDDPTSKSKSKLEKYLTDPMKKLYANSKAFAKKEWDAGKKAASSVWDKTKSFSKDVWGSTKAAANSAMDKLGGYVPDSVKNVGSSLLSGAKSAYNSAVDVTSRGMTTAANGVQSASNAVGGAFQSAGHGIATAFSKLTGSLKQKQMMVFQSFINAGFSKNQAMALAAEVGRENDYGSAMFGTHKDYASQGKPIVNLGYISWNGSRKDRLQAEAKAAGLLNPDGSLKEGQASLDLQARFVMEEMKGPYASSMRGFIDKPDVDPESAAAQVGKKYIGWAYGQSTLRNGNHFDWQSADAKRRNYLKNLQDAVGKTNIATKPVSTNPVVAPKGAGTVPVSTPANAAAVAAGVKGGAGGGAPSPARLPGQQAPSSTTAISPGMTSPVGASSTPVSSGQPNAAGAPPIDQALVALGKKAIKLQGDVDLSGMNQQFMSMFYAMVGEYWKSTGRTVQINSAYRNPEKQKAMYAAYLARGKTKPLVAVPGRSNHEKGLAIDINSAEANDMDSSGLMRKYKFHRPLLKHPSCPEPWHVENLCFGSGAAADATVKGIITDGKRPVTKSDLDKAKPDPNKPMPGVQTPSATTAITPTPSSPRAATPITSSQGGGSEAEARAPVANPGQQTPNQTQQIASARMPAMGVGSDVAGQVAAMAQRDRKTKTDADMDQLRNTSADAMVKEQKLTNMKLDTIITMIAAAAKARANAPGAAQQQPQQAAGSSPPTGQSMSPLQGQSASSMKNPFANPPVNFGLS